MLPALFLRVIFAIVLSRYIQQRFISQKHRSCLGILVNPVSAGFCASSLGWPAVFYSSGNLNIHGASGIIFLAFLEPLNCILR